MNYECNGYQINTETSADRKPIFDAYAEVILRKEKTEKAQEEKKQ